MNDMPELTREMIENTAKQMDTKLFKAVIRECIKTKEAQESKKLLIDYAPKCNTCLDYIDFSKELLRSRK